MSDRDRFLKHFQFAFARMIERIQTMDEAQILRQLQALQASRENVTETMGFLQSVALAPPDDPEDEINKLRSQLNSSARAGSSPFGQWDYMEAALKKRLETLRRKGGGE